MAKFGIEPEPKSFQPLGPAEEIETLEEKISRIVKHCSIWPKLSDRNACLFRHDYFVIKKKIDSLKGKNND